MSRKAAYKIRLTTGNFKNIEGIKCCKCGKSSDYDNRVDCAYSSWGSDAASEISYCMDCYYKAVFA